ncbi:polysaccharide biosynthesis/export family protein [Spirosoma telluris]|uniref:polysaccharide biosynthesis/export family protein n=1 Tax=Spirosoma telluris TaxID=2183553 RepID=UPI002FC38F5C
MPLIGRLKVAGLTLDESETFIKDKLDKYLKETTVNVRQLNHKFTVIGEVTRPGIYNLIDNHTSFPEAIGIAGDLTVYGRRDNVMLIRTVKGKREVVKLDLTSRNILDSPYYFIQNNDVVYVEPRQGKITSTDRTVQLLPIFLGVTSTLLVIVNLILR